MPPHYTRQLTSAPISLRPFHKEPFRGMLRLHSAYSLTLVAFAAKSSGSAEDMFASVKLALLCKFSVSLLIDVNHFRQTQLISTQLPWFPHYSPSSQIKVNLLPTRSQLVRKNSMPNRRMRNVARQSLPCRCPYTTVGTSAATSCRTKSLSS